MAESILVVEDDELMLEALEILLQDEGYEVTTASNGIEALLIASSQTFDLVISDVQMAEMDGIETISNLKKTQPGTRSIVITGYASPDIPIKAIKMGVDDYILKPFDEQQFLNSVKRCLESYKLQKAYTQGLQQQWRDFSSIIKLLAQGVEERDEHFAGHSQRVAELAVRIGKRRNLSRERLEILELAAFLHDIGNIGQKTAFLAKADELLSEELNELHEAVSQQSESLFSSVSSLREVFQIILHHHEWFDGSGYPQGLKGDQIPQESRILCVAEAYDAMISPRPHRQPLSHHEARQMLEKETTTHFDPEVVESALLLLTNVEDESEETVKEEALSKERQAQLLLGLSRTYLAAGDLDTAARGFAAVAEMLELEASGALVTEAHGGLCLTSFYRGQLAQARAEAERAVEASANQSQLVRARALQLRGLVRGNQGEVEQGLADLTSALETFRTWQAYYEVSSTLLYLANVLKLAGNATAAGEHLLEAVNLVDTHGLHSLIKQERALAIPMLLGLMAQGSAPSERILQHLAWDVVAPFVGELPADQREKAMARLGGKEDSAVPEVPPLSIYALGNFRVFAGGAEVGDKIWKTKKSKYLFVYFASHAGRDVPDEKIMDLFWPDHQPEKARQSLYAALSHIRKALESANAGETERVVLARKGFYRFDSERSYFYDVREFDTLYQEGQANIKSGHEEEAMVAFQKAENLYSGDFLEGYYEDWAMLIRDELSMRRVDMLQTLMDHFYDLGRYEVCIDYAHRLLKIDSCHQEGHLALMQCFIALQKPDQAVRQYQACSQVMKNELNLSPPREATELYLSITG